MSGLTVTLIELALKVPSSSVAVALMVRVAGASR